MVTFFHKGFSCDKCNYFFCDKCAGTKYISTNPDNGNK